jgi:hypothetical protein
MGLFLTEHLHGIQFVLLFTNPLIVKTRIELLVLHPVVDMLVRIFNHPFGGSFQFGALIEHVRRHVPEQATVVEHLKIKVILFLSMRHETIAMEVSPLEFEGIRTVDFDAQVNDDEKMVIVTMSGYFIGDLHDECIKKARKIYKGYRVKTNMGM